MKWLEVFKIYNLKQMKNEYILIFFTSISIFIATNISLIIPQVNLENERFIENNIEKLNGGDLFIDLMGEQQESFFEKLEELEVRGLKVTTIDIENCEYKKESNNIIGRIANGDYSLKSDEIILNNILANSLGVKVGEHVEVNDNLYKIKEIESFGVAVDRDTELLGYGKIQGKGMINGINKKTVINISGSDGELLKKELLAIEDGNGYTTINDKRIELKDTIFIQKISLGILTAVSYIFSSLAIISTTIMIILKRRKDIAILELLAIKRKEIKKALRLEILLWILIPILLSGVTSYFGTKIITSYSGMVIDAITRENILIIVKGMAFNGIVFFILMNIALMIVKGINPISALKNNQEDIRKENRKVIAITAILAPVFLIIYGLVFNSFESIGSSLLVIILILIFLAIVSVILKLISLNKFRNPLLIYSIGTIKNRFFSFILLLVSLTLTLWIITIGFNLEDAIKENFNNSLSKTLPYNYYVESNTGDELEEKLKSSDDVEGYIKSFSIDGKVKNEKFNEYYRTVFLSEVNKEDYGIKYKIKYGRNLFEGEEGLLISDEVRERNSLNLGDEIKIETNKGVISGRIKGVYLSGGINTGDIYKENVEFAERSSYLVKAKMGNFIDSITNSSIIAISDIGDGIASNVTGFLKVFRILSIISIVGTIIFNVNMVYMNCEKDEKDEEVLIALGFKRSFIINVQIIKGGLVMIFSSILSLGIYALIIKIFFKMMIKSNSEISGKIIVINLILAIIISIISFNLPIRKVRKKKELNLLREVN